MSTDKVLKGLQQMLNEILTKTSEFLKSMPKSKRKKKGQFFTPRPVVEMCVRMLNPKRNEYVIDPSCGSGGFLLHTMEWCYPANDSRTRADRKSNYASKYLWGIDFETRNDVTEAEYIEMIRLKTSVLLACALQIGAMLGGAAEQDTQALYRFGENLGLAFQLQDDYLDVYGDPAVFGKKIGGDILCNKKTFMLINAFLHASAEDRAELQRWIECGGDCNPDEKISAVTALYTKVGVDVMARERMDAYYAKAEACLDEVALPEERKQMLRGIALELMGRQS